MATKFFTMTLRLRFEKQEPIATSRQVPVVLSNIMSAFFRHGSSHSSKVASYSKKFLFPTPLSHFLQISLVYDSQ